MLLIFDAASKSNSWPSSRLTSDLQKYHLSPEAVWLNSSGSDMKWQTLSPASASDHISPELDTGWNVTPFVPLRLTFCFVFSVSVQDYEIEYMEKIGSASPVSVGCYSKNVCCFFLFKLACLLEFRCIQVDVYSLVCLVATVCEEAIVVPEVGLSIWQPHQEFLCTWIRAQLPLHRVRCTLLLVFIKDICSHFCIVLLYRLSLTAIYSALQVYLAC